MVTQSRSYIELINSINRIARNLLRLQICMDANNPRGGVPVVSTGVAVIFPVWDIFTFELKLCPSSKSSQFHRPTIERHDDNQWHGVQWQVFPWPTRSSSSCCDQLGGKVLHADVHVLPCGINFQFCLRVIASWCAECW